MKFFFYINLAMLTFISQAQAIRGLEMLKTIERTVMPQSVYAPMGFDDNDNVELIFEGYYPNACFKVGLSYSEVDRENKEIYISDKSMHHGHDFCADVIVPYKKEVSFGQLDKGVYKLFFQDVKKEWVQKGTLKVAIARTPAMDNHLYAPVDQTLFSEAKGLDPSKLVLAGAFHSSCMEMDRVEVVVHENSNTVDILPIAKLTDPNECYHMMVGRPFSETIDLSAVPKGRQLLHIRALNGKAINKIVNL